MFKILAITLASLALVACGGNDDGSSSGKHQNVGNTDNTDNTGNTDNTDNTGNTGNTGGNDSQVSNCGNAATAYTCVPSYTVKSFEAIQGLTAENAYQAAIDFARINHYFSETGSYFPSFATSIDFFFDPYDEVTDIVSLSTLPTGNLALESGRYHPSSAPIGSTYMKFEITANSQLGYYDPVDINNDEDEEFKNNGGVIFENSTPPNMDSSMTEDYFRVYTENDKIIITSLYNMSATQGMWLERKETEILSGKAELMGNIKPDTEVRVNIKASEAVNGSVPSYLVGDYQLKQGVTESQFSGQNLKLKVQKLVFNVGPGSSNIEKEFHSFELSDYNFDLIKTCTDTYCYNEEFSIATGSNGSFAGDNINGLVKFELQEPTKVNGDSWPQLKQGKVTFTDAVGKTATVQYGPSISITIDGITTSRSW